MPAPRRLSLLLGLLLVLCSVLLPSARAWVVAFVKRGPARSHGSRQQKEPQRPRPWAGARRRLPPLWQKGVDDEQGLLVAMGVAPSKPSPPSSLPSSPVGAVVHSHAAVLRALCPAVSRCRVYLPTELLPLDEDEDDDDDDVGPQAGDWRLGEAALVAYLAACEPLEGLGGAFLAKPDPADTAVEDVVAVSLPAAVLAPFGLDGWIAVELRGDGDGEGDVGGGAGQQQGPAGQEGLGRLASGIESLRVGLTALKRERAQGARAGARLRGLLREIRQPLGVLRTFGKLLRRRLEKTDAEGLNQELTGNVLVASDALVEVLRRYEEEQEGDKDDDDDDDDAAGLEREEVDRSEAPGPLSPSPSPRSLPPSEAASSTPRRRCDPRTVLAPVLAAARAISGRDGVQFQSFIEEGLPRIAVDDERGLQEALGLMVELALASSLAGAAAAAGDGDGPAVSLEARRVDGDIEGVAFVVRDNGLGDTAVLRGGKELARARKTIEQMGARLEIRRSASLGGTHIAVLFALSP